VGEQEGPSLTGRARQEFTKPIFNQRGDGKYGAGGGKDATLLEIQPQVVEKRNILDQIGVTSKGLTKIFK